jgi:O-antigen/teichoic acid export membrane protein
MASLDKLRAYGWNNDRKEGLRILLKSLFIESKPSHGVATGSDEAQPSAAGYASHIRTLIKSSGIYTLSSLAAPLISLILMPFLARHLSRTDYGALAVLNTATVLFAAVTQLGLGSAFFRSYSFDYESRSDRLSVLSTVVILLSLVSIPTCVIGIITAPWLSELLFKSPVYSVPVRFAAVVILLQNFTVPGLSWSRAENRAVLFVALNIANLLITLGATIILVGRIHLGVTGAVVANGAGYAFILISTLPLVIWRSGIRLRFDVAWGLLTFGVPNVANYISFWVLQLSDRFLLSHFKSLTQTASYAVAYTLGGALSVFILAPLSLAWPAFAFTIAKRSDAARIFQLVFRWYSIVLLFAAYGLSLLSIGMLDVLFPPVYHSAAPVIPIITVSIVFWGVYGFFVTGLGIRRKMWFLVMFMTIAALVNVGCNLVLIPLYGSIGAAVSTLIAYVVLAFVGYIVTQRIYPVPFEIGRFVFALLVGTALYIGSVFLTHSRDTYAVWGIAIGGFGLYSGFLLLFGMFPAWRRKYKSRLVQKGARLWKSR